METRNSNTLRLRGIVQVVDTLNYGGLEAVAVSYANLLSQRGIKSCICSTRSSGVFAADLDPSVTHLNLHRRGLVDFGALKRFLRFLREEEITIIHAHGTSLFFSALTGWFARAAKMIWHDHFGRYLTEQRSVLLHRSALVRASGVIAVNQPLAEWARQRLKVDRDRVWFLPNFVVEKETGGAQAQIPGEKGQRIVCVANLRPEKDHLTLIEAMRTVVETAPKAVLLVVGDAPNASQLSAVKDAIQRHQLQASVILMGNTRNVWPILKQCDIGVLSSASEGMPLALLEYGTAGLSTVATRVGQVPEVLDDGTAGLLVSPGEPAELATALIRLLQSPELRHAQGSALKQRIQERYSPLATINRLLEIYHIAMGARMQVS